MMITILSAACSLAVQEPIGSLSTSCDPAAAPIPATATGFAFGRGAAGGNGVSIALDEVADDTRAACGGAGAVAAVVLGG